MSRVPIVGVATLALTWGAAPSGVTAADSQTQRLDRNLLAASSQAPKVPAIPASNILVSMGRLTVPFGYQKHDLETLTATAPGAGPFPLALISHGIPRSAKELRNVRLRHLLPLAEDFARRGYRAVIFARRGFASSSGTYQESYGRCKSVTAGGYLRAGMTGAKDYAAVIDVLAQDPDIDGSTVIALGQSAGGFAVGALASRPPPGLVAVISFGRRTGLAAGPGELQ